MELVLEVINRGGRVLERHKLSGERITIGRAYNNDLILAEDSVSPHHGVLVLGEEQGLPVLKDLGSLNGIRGNRGELGAEGEEVSSGSEYLFGKVRVRIFQVDHPVAEAVSLGGIDRLVNRCGTISALLLSIVVLSAAYALELWLTTYSEFKWERTLTNLLTIAGVAIFATMFWALIGRIVKHEMRFRVQLTMIMAYLFLQNIVTELYKFSAFNTLSLTFSLGFYSIISLLLLCLLFWFNLYVATNQSGPQRWKTAAAMATALIAISLYPQLISKPDFSNTPEYVRVLSPPELRFADAVSEQEFAVAIDAVFERLGADSE